MMTTQASGCVSNSFQPRPALPEAAAEAPANLLGADSPEVETLAAPESDERLVAPSACSAPRAPESDSREPASESGAGVPAAWACPALYAAGLPEVSGTSSSEVGR